MAPDAEYAKVAVYVCFHTAYKVVVPAFNVIVLPGWYWTVPPLAVDHPWNSYPLLLGTVAGIVALYVEDVDV